MTDKYKPGWGFLDAANRFSVLKEGRLKVSSIAMFYKYPHLAKHYPVVEPEAVKKREPVPVCYEVDHSTEYKRLRYSGEDKVTMKDKDLLKELIAEHLRGSNINVAVSRKVYCYMLKLFDEDASFRDQFLGGVPHSDGPKFARDFLKRVLKGLERQSRSDGKIFRLPVHVAVADACKITADEFRKI